MTFLRPRTAFRRPNAMHRRPNVVPRRSRGVSVGGNWPISPSAHGALAEIHEALGADAARALPPLLAVRAVKVTLPEFMLRAMETAAADNGATLDAWLHHELTDFASSAVERMEPILPGYRAAFLYPGGE